jgi:hypothetical protein
MSAFEDIVEGIFDVGVMSVTYQVGQEAQRSFVKAAEEKNWFGMFLSALVCGGSMYAFQSSARDLNRLLRKNRAKLPIFDLQEDRSSKTPLRYLPKEWR